MWSSATILFVFIINAHRLGERLHPGKTISGGFARGNRPSERGPQRTVVILERARQRELPDEEGFGPAGFSRQGEDDRCRPPRL
jgi:hypothetical protein